MKDPGVPVLAAEWLFVCGNREESARHTQHYRENQTLAQLY